MVVYDVSSIVSKNRNVSDGKLLPINIHLVVHDCVNKHCDAILCQNLKQRKNKKNLLTLAFRCQDHLYLLGGDIVGLCPHINLLVHIDAGDDEEHARPFCGNY